jgi:hypothetical protein
MSDQIQRVARAMWEKRRELALRSDIILEEWGDGTIPKANGIHEEAAAAIAAMRESDHE